jgi:G:T/U-mismatch repair DNA glycosylase
MDELSTNNDSLDQIEWKKFPTDTFILGDSLDNTVCVVCLHRYKPNADMKVLPKCYHTFHPNCAYQWFKRTVTCPKCKRLVGKSEFSQYLEINESRDERQARVREATRRMEEDY